MKPLDHKRIIERELEGVGIRLNKKPPAITVTKKLKGGMNFSTSVKGGLTHLDEEGVRVILKEYSIVSANVPVRVRVRVTVGVGVGVRVGVGG